MISVLLHKSVIYASWLQKFFDILGIKNVIPSNFKMQDF